MAREDYPVGWLWQGDVNGDGKIDMMDLATIARNYKKRASEAPEGCDLDGDGWISVFDVEKASRNFGLTYEMWLKRLEARRPLALAITLLVFGLPMGVIGVGGRIT
jgi:hypothetical protein